MLKRHCNLENGDRISSLPESIICHILSFLPTKYAVRTSTLSTSWKYLWTSVTTLDFDDRIMGFRRARHNQFLANGVISCVSTMRRILLHRRVDSTVKKFEKLMVFKLSGKIYFDDINFSVCLKHLKVLHFLRLQNLHDAVVSKLIDLSPVLEELVIERAGKNSAKSLHLQSPSLKRLTISYEGDVDSIVVDSPQLEFIKLSENTPKVLKMIQSSSLVEADIQVGWSGMRKEVLHDYFDAAAQLLIQMSNIEILHLYSAAIGKTLKSFRPIKLCTFHNLIRLELRGSVLGTGVLPLVLKDSPKLKVIILHEMYSLKSTCVRALGEDVMYMWYMSCCLEVAELKGFTGSEAEMKIAKFLLKIANCLKKMVISFRSYNSKGLAAALNELLSFPRDSGVCQILFS